MMLSSASCVLPPIPLDNSNDHSLARYSYAFINLLNFESRIHIYSEVAAIYSDC